jgi:hypothetical protein
MVGALLFLAQFPVQAWTAVQRPDSLALALSLLGMSTAIDIPGRGRYSPYISPLVSGCLLCLVVLTRQTAVLPVVIVAGWYLLTGQRRLLAVFLGSVTGLLGGMMIWLQTTSDGGYFWQQFLLPASVAKTPQHALQIFLALLTGPATLITALLYLMGCLSRDVTFPPREPQSSSVLFGRYRRLLHLYVGLTVMVAAVTSARSGANVNYWLEASAAMAMATPTVLMGAIRGSGESRRRFLVAIIALGIASLITEVRIIRGEWFRWGARAYFDEVVLTIERITVEGEPTFSVYPDLPAAARRPKYFNDIVQND